MDELTKLKYWLDSELTILHIMFAVLLGVTVGGKIWYFIGLYIFISLVYLLKRTAALPRDYLKIKEIK